MTVTTDRAQPALDCTPLDLSPHLGDGRVAFEPEYLDALDRLPAGPQRFRGVPFALAAADAERRWIDAGAGATVDAAGVATHVVFAHACAPVAGQVGAAEFDLWEGAGDQLARYVLVFADGSEQAFPIRRRLEVNEWVPGLTPPTLTSVTHANFRPVDWRGPHERQAAPVWGSPGSSSMKAMPGSWAANQGGFGDDHGMDESTYWLYAAAVEGGPRELSSIRIEPAGGHGLLVGGITLFRGTATPLLYEAARTLLVQGDGIGVGSELSIDLGVADLPRRRSRPIEPSAWLGESFTGWGDLSDDDGDGVLVDVSGSPDATLTVGGVPVPLARIGDAGSVLEHGGIRIEVLEPARRTVRVHVVDGRGRPTPSRVHVEDAHGRYLPPAGHRSEVNLALMEDYGADIQLGGVAYAYVDCDFEIDLPLGDTYWEVSQGFETNAIRRRVRIGEDTTELRFELERWIDMRADGWVTADTHTHFVPPPTALLEARAEDLNFVHVLATQWGYLFSSVGDFPYGSLVREEDETAVYVGSEQRQPVLGHMSLLNPGSLIFPLGHGGEPTSPIGTPLQVLMADWADRCRAGGGLVVSPHFPFPYGEIAADVVLGKIDAIEIFGLTEQPDGPRVRDYYRFLDCGYRVPLVSGTDKMSAGTPVGALRTYARLEPGDAFGFESWARAVRAGRTFLSSGPMIWLAVDGAEPGATLELDAAGGTVEVEARAAAPHALGTLEVVVNGSVVASRDAAGATDVSLRASVPLDGTSWIAARCTSPFSKRTAFPTAVGAHTSAVYAQCGERQQLDAAAARTLLVLIDGCREWVETLAVCESESERRRLAGFFVEAHAELTGRLSGITPT